MRQLKEAVQGEIGIGGATLAAEALRAGLVDDLCQFLTPVVMGGGTRFLPDGVRIGLELVDERRFAGGMVYLHYRVRN